MDYEIEVQRLEPQPTWMVRGRVPMEEFPTAIGDFLEAVAERIDAAGEEPVGPPYTRYHEVGEEEVELEAGFPVPDALADGPDDDAVASGRNDAGGAEDPARAPGDLRVRSAGLPGGEAAATEHWGSYEDLPAAAAAIGAWVARNGRRAAGARWEVYWTDPSAVDDVDEIRTDVYVPLEPGPDFS